MSSKFNGEAVKSLGGEFIKKTFSELIKLTFPGRKLHSPTHLNAKIFSALNKYFIDFYSRLFLTFFKTICFGKRQGLPDCVFEFQSSCLSTTTTQWGGTTQSAKLDHWAAVVQFNFLYWPFLTILMIWYKCTPIKNFFRSTLSGVVLGEKG